MCQPSIQVGLYTGCQPSIQVGLSTGCYPSKASIQVGLYTQGINLVYKQVFIKGGNLVDM